MNRVRWLKGQLHVHTSRSFDGRVPPEDMFAAYRLRGFDFLCVTDHDRVWERAAVVDGILVVPGEESTLVRPFPPLGRHLVRLFTTEPVPLLASAHRKLEATRRQGALAMAAHPAWDGNFGTGRWRIEALADPLLDLVEIVNHHSRTGANVALWDEALARRGPALPLWATAVDDSHRLEQVGRAWVWVAVEQTWDLSLPAARLAGMVREALRRGAFYPSTGARAIFRWERDGGRSRVVVEAVPPEDEAAPGVPPRIRLMGKGGRLLVQVEGRGASYAVRGDEGYVRAEVIEPDGRAAWSQPWWIEA